MEPVRDTRATLVDLLDRVLDKGIMLDADLMITMAGIPLIGIKLKAAIAGIETMLEYGLWNDWDEAQRAYAAEGRRRKELGLSFEMRTVPIINEDAVTFLMEDEETVQKEKMWYLLEHPAPGGETAKTWKSGWLYLTNKRVCWWYDFDRCVAFEAELSEINGVNIETKDLGGMLKERLVLVIENAYFSGAEEAMRAIEKELEKRMKISSVTGEVEMETCPSCGRRAPVMELLHEGCKDCGWESPRLKERAILAQ